MSSIPLSIAYDDDAWIHVPLDYEHTLWQNVAEWADGIAENATRDREGGADLVAAIRAEAPEIARFPAAHVTARFWRFPLDADPTWMVDAFVQARPDDGAVAEKLLPEPGFTPVDLVSSRWPRQRRGRPCGVSRSARSCPAKGPSPHSSPKRNGSPSPLPGSRTSSDHDVAQLRARLDDGDALFAALVRITSEVDHV